MGKLDKATVLRISCSSKHALIATNTGSVFSWGENEFGQLGHNIAKNKKGVIFDGKPRKVESLSKQFAIDVACGNGHSVVLTNDRNVFLWGSNK